MTTQAEQSNAQDQKTELSAEQQAAAKQDQDDNAAFAEGFDGAESAVPVLKQTDAATDDPAKNAAASATAQGGDQSDKAAPANADANANAEQLDGLTDAEIRALHARVGELSEYEKKTEQKLQQIFGKFGDFQRQITAASGAVLSKREIKAETLKQLNAEYPDIAPLLAGDLGELLAGMAGGPTQEQMDELVKKQVATEIAAVKQSLTPALSAREIQEEQQYLAAAHPDWANYLPGKPGKVEIDQWLLTRAPGYRRRFMSSEDAEFISEGLDKFKAWKQSQQVSRQQPNNPSRLERSIPATGGRGRPGTHVDDGEAAFVAGFMGNNGAG